jgi:ABC-type glycerol-3-phosphate transport system substrate-binding protein
MLEAAEIDEGTAFETPEQMDETFSRLQASGVASPWVAPTTRISNTLHHIASWVWQRGGDFVSEDGTRTLFCQPEALAGICDYFRLHRYLPQDKLPLQLDQIASAFARRRAAAMMDGPWSLTGFTHPEASPNRAANLGVALPPGPPFVGPSNLVIWGHIAPREERAAVEWVNRLIAPETQYGYCSVTGLLPVRLDVLSEPPYSTDPYWRIFGEALHSGHAALHLAVGVSSRKG